MSTRVFAFLREFIESDPDKIDCLDFVWMMLSFVVYFLFPSIFVKNLSMGILIVDKVVADFVHQFSYISRLLNTV